MTNPVNGGRFGDLRTIYQGCRALPFALAGLSCMTCLTNCAGRNGFILAFMWPMYEYYVLTSTIFSVFTLFDVIR